VLRRRRRDVVERLGPIGVIVGSFLCARAGPWVVDWAAWFESRVLVGVGLSVLGTVVALLIVRFDVSGRRVVICVLCVLSILLLPLWTLRALSGLTPSRLGSIDSIATVRSDGDQLATLDGYQVTLEVDGKLLRSVARGKAGATVNRLQVGSRVHVQGRVSEWSGEVPSWAVSRHLAGQLQITDVALVDHGRWWWRVARWVRITIRSGASVLPESQQPLFLGFLLGDDRGQHPAVTDDFRAAGLSHLLVVSGQNVAFVLVAVQPIIARFAFRWRALAALVVIFAFALLTRFEPSVLRASTMAALTVMSRSVDRPQDAMRSLALAVVVLLFIDPLLAWSVGFGLSVCATLGLAVLSRPIERRLRGAGWFRAPLAATIAAQVGTFPLLLGFGGVSPISIGANLIALPMAEPVMVWGVIVGLPAGLLGDGAARVLHAPTMALTWWIANVARYAAWLVRVLAIPAWWPLIVVALFVVWSLQRRNGDRPIKPGADRQWIQARIVNRRAMFGNVGMAVLLIVLGLGERQRSSLAPASLGRTPSALWRDGSRSVLVFRAGSSPTAVLAELRIKRVKRLDAVVLHKDSRLAWNQLSPVLARFPATVFACGAMRPSSAFRVTALGANDRVTIWRGVPGPGRVWLQVRCEQGVANVTATGLPQAPDGG
jgi:ComEC/Rec2-related protein